MNHIFTRVSIRKYQDRPVEKEKTLAIFRAAMQAPSAGNRISGRGTKATGQSFSFHTYCD